MLDSAILIMREQTKDIVDVFVKWGENLALWIIYWCGCL